MDVTEIIQNSLAYPFANIPALLIYVVLGIISGIILFATGFSSLFVGSYTELGGVGVLIIGLILFVIIHLAIYGYLLDVVKIAINRGTDSPSVDIVRQAQNGLKLFIVYFVYFLIPIILTIICAMFFKNWIVYIISFVLFVIFALAATMAECRLAETEELSTALVINGAINDINRVGALKILITVIVLAVIMGIFLFISGIIGAYINDTLGGVLLGVVEVYFLFVSNRAVGLLYSDR